MFGPLAQKFEDFFAPLSFTLFNPCLIIWAVCLPVSSFDRGQTCFFSFTNSSGSRMFLVGFPTCSVSCFGYFSWYLYSCWKYLPTDIFLLSPI